MLRKTFGDKNLMKSFKKLKIKFKIFIGTKNLYKPN